VVEAIDTAAAAGVPLKLAGIIADQEYFDTQVAPRLVDDRVQFVGPVRAEDRSAFLGGALALLHLINFDEPFGFSVVEAMACGTPVVAFDRGSMRELIEEGTTGRLVSDVAGAVDAVAHIGTLDRLRIRSQAVTRFGHDRMVDAYVAVYRQVVAAGPGRSVG
jgi:glycosyltransferase involved in cell wall biosynthesis